MIVLSKKLKNIFLFLFFIGATIYGYANVTNNFDLKYITKFFLAPAILLHYVINSKKRNILYIIALLLALTGDLLFSESTKVQNIIATGCFIIYNLLLTTILFELFGAVDLKKIISIVTSSLITLCLFIYITINNVGSDIIMIYLYFLAFAVLLAFSLFYYLKLKTKESFYFLIGVSLFLIANLSKVFQYYENTGFIMKILNIISYAFSFYFYYRGILLAEETTKAHKKTQPI